MNENIIMIDCDGENRATNGLAVGYGDYVFAKL